MAKKESVLSKYAKSWNLFNIDTAFIIIYELVFCCVMYLLGILFYGQVLKVLQGLKHVNLNQAVMLAQPQVVTENIDLVHGVLGKVGLYLFLMLISGAFIYAFFNLFIWARIANKRLTQNYISKWVLADFVWTVVWAVILAASLFVFEMPYVIFILAFLFFAFLHFTLHFHIVLTQRNDQIIKRSLKQATANFPSYFLPYLLMIATYWVLTFLVSQMLDFAPWKPWAFVILYFILITTWMRKYVFTVTT